MEEFYKKHAEEFKFGWEVELMITDNTYTPLFGDNLNFEHVQEILNSISVAEIPYLKEKYTGSGLRPYYVEGYDAGYLDDKVKNVIVKGIEIRTPIAFTLEHSVRLFEEYYNTASQVFEKHNLFLSCFGNHLYQPHFAGEQGRRDVNSWAAAEVAMTTHGLVINISLPDMLEEKLNRTKLNNRMSYASPAMILLAGDTPFKNGELWKPEGRQAFSDRSYRRSFVRDTVYYRDDQHNRKEVTLFDMSNDLSLYLAFGALSLGLILSDEEFAMIPDRFSKENVRRASKFGYSAEFIGRNFEYIDPAELVETVLSACSKALVKYGFDGHLINPLWKLLEKKEMPAHKSINEFCTKYDKNIPSFLKSRSRLYYSEVVGA